MSVKEKVRQRIAEILGLETDRCTPDAVLRDLVVDSFRLVELAIELQEDFAVRFTQDDLNLVHRVEDLENLVAQRQRD